MQMSSDATIAETFLKKGEKNGGKLIVSVSSLNTETILIPRRMLTYHFSLVTVSICKGSDSDGACTVYS